MAIHDGTSFTSEKFSAVFYRGDGVQTAVVIPDNVTRVRVRPYLTCKLLKQEGGANAVAFDRPPAPGMMIRITLEEYARE
jgi:hypothetical protein